MENDLYVNYDALCYATFINIKTLTSGVNYIYLKGFDYDNEDHQFVLAVIHACYSILEEKDILVDVGPFARKAISKRYPCFTRVRKPKGEPEVVVDINELLEFMYPTAQNLCGPVFLFSDIYHAYYSEKGKDR